MNLTDSVDDKLLQELQLVSRTAGSRIVVARNNDRPGLFRYKSSSRP